MVNPPLIGYNIDNGAILRELEEIFKKNNNTNFKKKKKLENLLKIEEREK